MLINATFTLGLRTGQITNTYQVLPSLTDTKRIHLRQDQYQKKVSEIFYMSSNAYCPYCGEKKREVSRSIGKCVHCEKPLPECPECLSRNVEFIGVDLLGCYGCKTKFSSPGPLRNKGKEADKSDWDAYWDRLEE